MLLFIVCQYSRAFDPYLSIIFLISTLTTVYCFVRSYATHTHRSLTVYLRPPSPPQCTHLNTHRFRHPYAPLPSFTTVRGTSTIFRRGVRHPARRQVVAKQGHMALAPEDHAIDSSWHVTALVIFALYMPLYRWSMIFSVKSLRSNIPPMATPSGSPALGDVMLQ